MKRSTQVTLVLMGAVGVGGVGYAMSANCRPHQPSAVASDDQKQQPACRSSGSHFWDHGWSDNSRYRYTGRSVGSNFFGFGSPGVGTSSVATPVSAPTVQRGGFGSFGRAIASLSGGG